MIAMLIFINVLCFSCFWILFLNFQKTFELLFHVKRLVEEIEQVLKTHEKEFQDLRSVFGLQEKKPEWTSPKDDSRVRKSGRSKPRVIRKSESEEAERELPPGEQHI